MALLAIFMILVASMLFVKIRKKRLKKKKYEKYQHYFLKYCLIFCVLLA